MTGNILHARALSSAADAAAVRWDRWGPPEVTGYPLPHWRDLFREAPEKAVQACESWAEAVGVADEERRMSEDRLRRLHDAGVRTITILDPEFPPQLRAIGNPPLVLHVIGKNKNPQTGFAMVGSREPSLADLEEVERLGKWLGQNRMTVITGMARGVDKASVLVATRYGGSVLGVVPGSPIETIPQESAEAYEQARLNGCLVSEVTGMPRGSQSAIRSSFLRRNRIISGMARVVVAFRPRARGGTFNQLEWASRQNRPIIVVGPEAREDFVRAAHSHFPFTESEGQELLRDAGKLWTRRPESNQATLA